jgi:hypothetical protein
MVANENLIRRRAVLSAVFHFGEHPVDSGDTLLRLIGGIYFAICDALGEEGAALANESLYAFASENADAPDCASLCVTEFAETQKAEKAFEENLERHADRAVIPENFRRH